MARKTKARPLFWTPPLQLIETDAGKITILCGGPNGKKQRLERSLRPHLARRRHTAFSRADFLHAQGCALLGLVQPHFAGESSCAKFHRTVRRNHRRNLLSHDRRGRVSPGGGSARVRRGETISFEFACDAANRLDRSLHRVGRLPLAVTDTLLPRLAFGLQHSRARRLGRLLPGKNRAAQCHGQGRLSHSLEWNLRDDADPDDWTSADSPCSRNDRDHAPRKRKAARMALAPATPQFRS